MDRPVTSRSRGICRYYNTARGCYAGDDCKFLHGVEEKLTPYDKAKVCRYYARGHCTRGDQCWFRHELLKMAPDDERVRFNAETCCICLEKPITYGLLTDCSHVFCLECIRQWRAPAGKSVDIISSGTIKCCPLCRTTSRFVTPSAHFFPQGSSRKKETVDAYKASMARVPCRYFEETTRIGKPCCPFGTDCFYQHTNPDGTPHIFRHGAKHSMTIYRRSRLRGASFPRARFEYDDPIQFLQHIFENPITNLHATLDVIRASLPALMGRFEEAATSNDETTIPESALREDPDEFDPFGLTQEPLVWDDNADTLLPNVSQITEQDFLSPRPVPSASIFSRARSVSPILDLADWTPLPPPRPSSSAETRIAPGAISQESASTSTPSLSGLSQQPRSVQSRFSTVVNSRSRDTFIIEISDEEDSDDEEELILHPSNIAPSSRVESTPDTHPVDDPTPDITLLPQSETPADSGSTPCPAEAPPNRPQCEHDADPPFMTDGRGRVVWSSTRSPSGRGAAASRRSRQGSSARLARPSSSSAIFVTNGRGHVALTGQDVQEGDVKGVVGGEETAEADQ